MEQTCVECKRLSEELADATKDHIRLAGQKQLADMEQNSALMRELEPLVRKAADRREEARRAFREHAATHTDPSS